MGYFKLWELVMLRDLWNLRTLRWVMGGRRLGWYEGTIVLIMQANP